MINYLLIIIGVATTALAQVMLKKSGQFVFFKDINFFIYFILGGLSYVISFGLYAYLLKAFNISKISPIMTISTMLVVVTSGILVFKEVVTLKQLIGILLGAGSILLLLK